MQSGIIQLVFGCVGGGFCLGFAVNALMEKRPVMVFVLCILANVPAVVGGLAKLTKHECAEEVPVSP